MKVHKDCPLTKEEMDAIKAELYYINSTNHCLNPPHPSWYRGLNDWQTNRNNHAESVEVLAEPKGARQRAVLPILSKEL